MNDAILHGLMDELEKISERLTKKERREQAVKFTGLGAAALPVISGVGNIIAGKGRGISRVAGGARPGRWLAARSLEGAAIGGALPAVRHQIERDMKEKARERRELAKYVESSDAR
jgi:hypothetical protein